MMPLTVLEKTDKPRIMCNEVYGVEKKNVTPNTPQLALRHVLRSSPQRADAVHVGLIKWQKCDSLIHLVNV